MVMKKGKEVGHVSHGLRPRSRLRALLQVRRTRPPKLVQAGRHFADDCITY